MLKVGASAQQRRALGRIVSGTVRQLARSSVAVVVSDGGAELGAAASGSGMVSVSLARDIHDGPLQRLFGLSLVLRGDGALSDDERQRCGEELSRALDELRQALRRTVLSPEGAPASEAAGDAGLDVDALRERFGDLPLSVEWPRDAAVPPEQAPLVRAFLEEALRNVRKHAAPSRVMVRAVGLPGWLRVDVTNDGACPGEGRRRRGGAGVGLRLLEIEARAHGAAIETGMTPGGRWRARLQCDWADAA